MCLFRLRGGALFEAEPSLIGGGSNTIAEHRHVLPPLVLYLSRACDLTRLVKMLLEGLGLVGYCKPKTLVIATILTLKL